MGRGALRRIGIWSGTLVVVAIGVAIDLAFPDRVLWAMLIYGAVAFWAGRAQELRDHVMAGLLILAALSIGFVHRDLALDDDFPLRFATGAFCLAHLAFARRTSERLRESDRITLFYKQTQRSRESVLSSLIEVFPIHFFEKDLDGRFILANERFCDWMGLAWRELEGKTDRDLFSPEMAERFAADDARVIALTEQVEQVETFQRPGTPEKHVRVVKAPVFDEHGNVTGVRGMFWDVTERFREEQRRHLSDRRYRELVYADLIGVVIAGRDGSLVESNDAFLRMLGYSREELSTLRREDLWPPERREEDRRALDALVERRTAAPRETEVRRKDGALVPVVIGQTMFEENPDEYITVLLDISEQKRAQEDLRRAKESADAALRTKSLFVANISHEVRTPMNAILGMTEVVLGTSLSGEQREYLETVRDSAEHLLGVIDAVLDFSRLEAGKMSLSLAPFSPRDNVVESLRAVAVRAHQKKLELLSDVDADVPIRVIGDPARLRQALINLVGNAIKFTDRGDVTVRVKVVKTAIDRAVLEYQVRDTGIGISEEARGRIFQAFEQADNSSTRAHGGTGLGLAIVKSLVELMGGRIAVESEPGKGSCFRFSIKVRVAEPGSAEADIAPLTRIPRHVAAIVPYRRLRGHVVRMLRGWGVQAIACEDLEEFEVAAELDPDRDNWTLVVDESLSDDQIRDFLDRLTPEWAARLRIVLLRASGAGRRLDELLGERMPCAVVLKPMRDSDILAALTQTGRREAKRRHALSDSATPPPPARLAVLLVEDSVVNQKLAVTLLAARGHDAAIAANGAQAIEALASGARFDLVLMDVQMPVMDGIETSRAIRKRWGSRLPIVALTAHAMQGDRERCLEAGMTDYLSKPLRRDELYRLLYEFELVRAGELQRTNAARDDDDEPALAIAVGSEPWNAAVAVFSGEQALGDEPASDRDSTGDGDDVRPSESRSGDSHVGGFAAGGGARGRTGTADPSSSTNGTPAFDLDLALRNVAGDRALLADLITAFGDEQARLGDELSKSLVARDEPRFRRAAHTLKSNVRVFGAMRLSETLLAWERGGFAAAQDDLARVEGLRASLDALHRALGKAAIPSSDSESLAPE